MVGVRELAAVAMAVAVVDAGAVFTMPMHKKMTMKPPHSRVAAMLGGNGSSIPADGSVWPTAIYWCFAQVGTPPVSFPVAIDSGSGDLDISGKGCDGCVTNPPNKAYDARSSSTSRPVFPFKFSNSYQTCDLKDPTAVCTIEGSLYTDQVSLAGIGPVEVQLGSIEKQTSNFDQFKEIDGVMGFTEGGKKNVFAQLVANGKCDNVWSICMYEGTKSNGSITIGGVDPRLSDNVQYVPDAGVGFHAVEVKSMSLNGATGSHTVSSSIPVNQGAILDTGTNVLLVPSSVRRELQSSMCQDSSLASCSALWGGQCLSLTLAQVAAYPDLSMQLANGVELKMTAADYLLLGSPLASAPNEYCIGIKDGGSAGGSGFIIGDTTMRNYYLVFDLAEHRIGWGPVNKASCGSI